MSLQSSIAHAALQVVLEQWRGSVIQRQREEIERLRMEREDMRTRILRMFDVEGEPDSDDLFGDRSSDDDEDEESAPE